MCCVVRMVQPSVRNRVRNSLTGIRSIGTGLCLGAFFRFGFGTVGALLAGRLLRYFWWAGHGLRVTLVSPQGGEKESCVSQDRCDRTCRVRYCLPHCVKREFRSKSTCSMRKLPGKHSSPKAQTWHSRLTNVTNNILMLARSENNKYRSLNTWRR